MTTPPDLYAVFAPRRARVVAVVVAVLFMLMMILLGLLVPGAGLFDLVAFIACGVLVAWLLYRLAGVYAKPSPSGLVVRNLFITTRLEWAQIVSVRFGDRPWPQLDLSDGDTLAVMGIQRADGDFGRQEAVRLADLVEEHGAQDR